MRKRTYRVASYVLGLALLSASAAPAQTIDPSTVSGTVIVDGNDFLRAQSMRNMIQGTADRQSAAFERMMVPVGGGMAPGGGAAPIMSGPEMARLAVALGDKLIKLDQFTPSTSTVPHDLAVQLAAADAAKRARLEKLFSGLLASYRSVAPPPSKMPLGDSSALLLITAYAIQSSAAETVRALKEGPPDRPSPFLATANYVGALQLVSGHAATAAEKERIYDTIAISAAALDSENMLAMKRNDPQLKAKVQAQAAGMVKRLFGCSIQSTSIEQCIQHINDVSRAYEVRNHDAFLKL